VRVALYARISTTEQTVDNQRFELQRYCEARGWTITEFLDEGVSGAKESRPALDRLMTGARRRDIDAVVVWKLDRLGRSLKHLLFVIDELTTRGVQFISLGEGIDTGTAAGRLQLHILGALAEFERERIRERVTLGLARARRSGIRLGRRRKVALPQSAPRGLTVRAAAAAWGCSKTTAADRLNRGLLPPAAGQTSAIDPQKVA
jgi:putative DNA-invertase from lambdoid prophage Rac